MKTAYFWNDNGHIDDAINDWLSREFAKYPNLNVRDIRFNSFESEMNESTIDTALVIYYT